jgi:ribosomal protein S18 acetylase RimI-like enzyme
MPKPADQLEISVRRATAEDVNLLSSIATVSFYEAYFEQDDSHDLSNYLIENFSLDVIAADIASDESTYLIATRAGKAVGYAKLRDGEPHESIKSTNAIELQRFYLIERVWGTGVGDVLLDRCIAEARLMGKEVLWLGVWEENRRGNSFYAKHGFERVGTLTFPYGDSVGINAVMRIDL